MSCLVTHCKSWNRNVVYLNQKSQNKIYLIFIFYTLYKIVDLVTLSAVSSSKRHAIILKLYGGYKLCTLNNTFRDKIPPLIIELILKHGPDNLIFFELKSAMYLNCI